MALSQRFTNTGVLQTVGTVDEYTLPNDRKYSVLFNKAIPNTITAAASSNYAFGTGDFTIEAWIYLNSVDTVHGIWNNTLAGTGDFSFRITSSNKLNTLTPTLTGTATLSVNTWYHVAATRSGTTLRLFVNGVLDGTLTSSTNITDTGFTMGDTVPPRLGTNSSGMFNGYISNFRIVKGTAVYTTDFTPSFPLESISGTVVLTCQSSTISDNSSYNVALLPLGNVGSPVQVDYLVVAGGGGGGGNVGGGGGAGGLVSATSVTMNTSIPYVITVGAGGNPGFGGIAAPTALTTILNIATNGKNSSIVGGALNVVAYGGGGGGNYNGALSVAGLNGGSGGGAPGTGGGQDKPAGVGVYPGSTYINAARQGYDGGIGIYADSLGTGGGGGGSGGAGSAAVASTNGTPGGVGTSSSITGSAVTYATGGTGVFNAPNTGANGGLNTGNGGGGGALLGGCGGSGVVIISFPSSYTNEVVTGSPTLTISGSNKIYIFTQSGTIQFNSGPTVSSQYPTSIPNLTNRIYSDGRFNINGVFDETTLSANVALTSVSSGYSVYNYGTVTGSVGYTKTSGGNGAVFNFLAPNWTIEMWFNIPTWNDGTGNGLFFFEALGPTDNRVLTYFWSTGGAQSYFYDQIPNSKILTINSTPSINAWHHWALVSDKGIMSIYIDGVKQSYTLNISSFNGVDLTNIRQWRLLCTEFGAGATGNFAQLRINNRYALYTNDFNPSGKYSSIASPEGTILSTYNSSALVDLSPNAYTITRYANPSSASLIQSSPIPPLYTMSTSNTFRKQYTTGDYAVIDNIDEVTYAYAITPNKTLVNEGNSVSYVIDAKQLNSGTLYWSNSGTIVGADYAGGLNATDYNGALIQGTTTFITAGTGNATAGTYTNVTQSATSGTGTGAVFTIVKTTSTAYASGITLTVTSPGSGYAAGDTITILGTNFTGGTAPTNNLTITVTQIGPTKFTLAGTAITTAATYTGVTQSATSGVGSGAVFTISKIAGTAYTTTAAVIITSPGSGYTIGDTITLPGTSLGGAAPTNNLTLTITSIQDNSGPITITNGIGFLNRTLSQDVSNEGVQNIIAELRSGSTTGTLLATAPTVLVADTSRPITPAPAGGNQCICAFPDYVSGPNLTYDGTPGYFTFTAPKGYTTVSVVCIGGGGSGGNNGGGGGGGGALAYITSFAVTAGTQYAVIAGYGGGSAFGISQGTFAGGPSSFNSSTVIANGGQTGDIGTAGAGGTVGAGTGFAGGAGGAPVAGYSGGGGGGAGGYTAAGGAGGAASGTWPTLTAASGAASATGGAGGGAGGSATAGMYYAAGGGGGGTAPFGSVAVASIAGIAYAGVGLSPGRGGGGSGSIGTAILYGAALGQRGYTSSQNQTPNGGLYGGGGGGGDGIGNLPGLGAPGCVRIIWGTGRSYPATATTDRVFGFPSSTGNPNGQQ